MNTAWDAVVVGAGPAGCAAAIAMARRGVRVVVVEQRPFPRAKACGEYISPAATGTLESLVSRGGLAAAGARRVSTIALELGERAVEWRTPEPAWTLSRAGLDALLLATARREGVRVRQPARVRGVEYSDDAVGVTLANGDALHARVIIHTDGAGRFDQGGRATRHRPGALGVKCHFVAPRGEPVRGVRMRSCEGAYLGTVAVENGLATCAMTVREGIVARFIRDARFASKDDALDAMTCALWPGFGRCARAGPWLVTGIACDRYVAPGHARSFRVGNAAAAVEPVGGEGIGLALWSGATLGAVLDPGDPAGAQRALGRAYSARLQTRLPACRAAGEVLMRPRLVRALWPMLESPGAADALFGAFWTLTGKG